MSTIASLSNSALLLAISMETNQQKVFANKHRIDRVFQVEDLVYLRPQPYRQYSLKKKGVGQIQPRFYGPCKNLREIVKCPMSWRCHQRVRSIIFSMHHV